MPTPFVYSFLALGSECRLYLPPADSSQFVAELAEDEVRRIEQKYSRFRPDSDLSAINQAAREGREIELDVETAALMDYAAVCYQKSGGLFDITAGVLRRVWNFDKTTLPDAGAVQQLLPLIGFEKLRWLKPRLAFTRPGMELDFGGIGKEYAADRIADLCTENGVHAGLIDLGGDIRVLGPLAADTPWEIAIRHPLTPEIPMATIALTSGALATSGDYERSILLDGKRYSHILNPRTGWPVDGLSSVSVVAEQCTVAGSVATIAMLKAAEGPDWLATTGLRHLWMDQAGKQGGEW